MLAGVKVSKDTATASKKSNKTMDDGKCGGAEDVPVVKQAAQKGGQRKATTAEKGKRKIREVEEEMEQEKEDEDIDTDAKVDDCEKEGDAGMKGSVKPEKLKLKRGPNKLVEAIQSLNARQLDAIKEMGFGQLVHYNINAVPAELAYRLMKSFDPMSCNLVLNTGTVHISEEDVYLTLGLPRGEIMIERSGRNKVNEFMEDVPAVGGKTPKNMLPKYLVEQLHADQEGEVFLVLLVLLDSDLFASTGDGYGRSPILEYIDDISNVHSYNWCAYVLDVLVSSAEH